MEFAISSVSFAAISVILLGVVLVSTEMCSSAWVVSEASNRLAANPGPHRETAAAAASRAAARAACLERNASPPPWPPLQPPAPLLAFFLPFGHNPVPVNVAGMRLVAEVAQASVSELELAEKLGHAVTAGSTS